MECKLGFAKTVALEDHVKLCIDIHIHLETFIVLKNQVLNFLICLSSRVPLSSKNIALFIFGYSLYF